MGWSKARSAAWTTFGHRWWKWIVGFELAWKLAPVALAILAVGAVWALVTKGPGWLPDVDVNWVMWAAVGGGVVLLGALVAGWRWWNPPTSYRPHPWRGPLVATLGLVAVVAVVAVIR